ncbi:MAG: ABC transporter substrate-binding protein [Clostridiales bacterium]|nr:ABC transporter substrate-binding protein [Clostridiales bacterium]
MKKLVAFILSVVMAFSAFAFAESIRVAALNGPTGMGMVKLMKDEESGSTYEFTLAGAPDMITPALIKGEMDFACVPANLASVLYNRTNGKIVVLAVNTLGVLYIVERGDGVSSFEDLKGRTIYSAGKGSTPEVALNYLLKMNGLDPENDVDIQWKSEHAECLVALTQDDTALAMLPQPFVTVAQTKKDDIRIALDLTEEWDKLGNESGMVTGVVIARQAFVEEHQDETKAFLEAYAQSVEYVNANMEQAAKLIGEYGIVAENVAVKALPYCNIVCVTGDEMRSLLGGYLKVLFDENPEYTGGTLPGEDFYFVG